jgi:DNA repair protein RadC
MSNDYSALSNEELLGKLIGVRAASKVYKGTLQPLFSEASAPAKLIVARELVKRLLCEEMSRGCALTSPGAVRDYLKLILGDRDHEVFVCLWLDAQHRVIKTEEAFRGTLTQTAVYPREIVKSALAANAAAVLFAHNHPSGVAQPSQSDELLTRNLKEALALVEVKVLDHFIVAGRHSISFAERGLL